MTMTVTPSVDTGVSEPRIRLVVATDTSSPQPAAPAGTLTVNRTDPSGTSERVILEAGARLSGGAWTGFDYHPPFNVPVTYTVTTNGYTSAASSPVTQYSSAAWLMHPNNPALSVQLAAVTAIGDRTKASTSVASFSFGATYPVALSEGTRRAATGQLIIRIDSKQQQQALDALLADSGPILINLAGNDGGLGWWDETWAWVTPGNVVYSNPGGTVYYPYRHITLPYQVVDTPTGLAVPIWTCGQLTASQYTTCGQVTATYATCSDLTTNTVGSAQTGLLLTPDPSTPGYYFQTGLVPASTPHYYVPPTGSAPAPSTEYDGGSF